MFLLTFLVLFAMSVSCGMCSDEGEREDNLLFQLYNGIALQFRLLKSSGFVFNIDTKMWNVVDSLIATMQKQKAVYQLEKEGMVEGKVVRAISAVLDSVANDSCEYLTEKVSGWYPDFTCSESQLRDIASRIKFMNSTRNIHHIVRDTANLTDYPGENECNYWNHRIVGGDCGVLSGGGLDGSVGPTAKALDWEPEGAEAGHEDLEWVERNVLKKIRAYHFCSFCTS